MQVRFYHDCVLAREQHRQHISGRFLNDKKLLSKKLLSKKLLCADYTPRGLN